MLVGTLLCASLSSRAADATGESPHWSKSACATCHDSDAPTDNSDVRLDNHSALCVDCHDEAEASTCPHPSNLPVQDFGQLKLPESYRSATFDDQIVCTSCHSVTLQCTGGRREQYENSAFLRKGSSRPGQVCFDCHDIEHYEKLNSHNAGPNERTQTCLFCHNEAPNTNNFILPDLRLSGDLQCTGCHRAVPHPLSAPGAATDEWTHLVVPTTEIVTRMKSTEDRTGIVLPLDPDDGSIRCTTCHNVHDPDLPDYPLRSEEGAANKLRMTDICEACHDK